MEQLILHLIGDYITQSDWMAENKTKAFFPAFVHALFYSLPFLWLTTHIPALLCISVTHFLIDRYRLARYVVWAKNLIGRRKTWRLWEPNLEVPSTGALYKGHLAETGEWYRVATTPPWRFCRATGYAPNRPDFLAVWLLIIADNTLHLAINYAALRWL